MFWNNLAISRDISKPKFSTYPNFFLYPSLGIQKLRYNMKSLRISLFGLVSSKLMYFMTQNLKIIEITIRKMLTMLKLQMPDIQSIPVAVVKTSPITRSDIVIKKVWAYIQGV